MAVIMPVHLCDDIFIIALYKKIINTGRKIKNAENIPPKSAGPLGFTSIVQGFKKTRFYFTREAMASPISEQVTHFAERSGVKMPSLRVSSTALSIEAASAASPK